MPFSLKSFGLLAHLCQLGTYTELGMKFITGVVLVRELSVEELLAKVKRGELGVEGGL